MAKSAGQSRWFWIELIGFDNRLPDFGVGELLERAGFVPEAVALLLFNPDFVHTHDGMTADLSFQADICSYGGYPASEERERQVWTKYQLRGLVAELQAHGSKVFPAVFDLFTVESPWLAAHPEVRHVSRTRGQMRSLCPWKRLADGSFYEDFFIGKLVEILGDYGFDGYFGADGYNPPRIPIYDGDFSDDMVDQFLAATGLPLPTDLADCDGDPARIEARGKWIWDAQRRAWIDFQVARRTAFWRKLTTAVHALDKPVYITSTWTKGPFESIYRFGVDYAALASAGVDGFVLEAAAAALESESATEASSRILCNFAAAVLQAKACTPQTPMWWLHGVKDTNENWQAIRQVPMALESEIMAYANLFRHRPVGKAERCVEGPMVCLADCITAAEWNWLTTRWELGFGIAPDASLSATLLWSNAALQAQIDDYIAAGNWTGHRLLHHLLARGAAVHTVADASDTATVPGTQLILNAHLWDKTALARAIQGAQGPVVVVGADGASYPDPILRVAEEGSASPLACLVYGNSVCADALRQALPISDDSPAPEQANPTELPLLFYDELPYRHLSELFLQRCAALVNACCRGPVRIIGGGEGLSLWALRDGDRLRLVIRNDRYLTSRAFIDVGATIGTVDFRNSATGKRILPSGSQFHVMVPGRGTAILELMLDL